jgi:hypothetical protein
MRLMRFRYTISHVSGKDLIIADALSGAPSTNIEKSESDFENDTTAFVDMIMESFPASNNRLKVNQFLPSIFLSILHGINGIIPELSDHSIFRGGFPQVYYSTRAYLSIINNHIYLWWTTIRVTLR